jgi:hypothetical protein
MPTARQAAPGNSEDNSMFATGEYVLAQVVGFTTRDGQALSEIRCRVTEARDGYVWVTTADLRTHAGVALVLDQAKVRNIPQADTGLIHRNGLVVLG